MKSSYIQPPYNISRLLKDYAKSRISECGHILILSN